MFINTSLHAGKEMRVFVNQLATESSLFQLACIQQNQIKGLIKAIVVSGQEI